ncbi:PBP1A family penicillin-binding protein [candidate division KSB1 bacterium]|nr:PBP1A family penicillin-binding protein [candidate division KSB1 bacterium]
MVKRMRIFSLRSIVLLLLVLAVAVWVTITLSLPQLPNDLNTIALSTPTTLYADDGQVIKVMANRMVVGIDQVSPDLLNAIVVLEDHRFYSHHGFSKRGFLRALVLNTFRGRVREGGSTITQQLAKNLFFTFERLWSRKAKELLIALQIERQFSKKEILEAYINQIDFGSGVYGVELASQTYFAKHADELSLAEAAMLAGIPRWPARYSPYSNFDVARERQIFVLKRMEEKGHITREQRLAAEEEEPVLGSINPFLGHADYFIQQVRRHAKEKYGDAAVDYGGLQIHTTLNLRLQFLAHRAVQEAMDNLDRLFKLPPYAKAPRESWSDYPQAALVAIDPHTGQVKAVVGGRDYRRTPFNRAFSNLRHAGSAFKPFTYLAALDQGVATPKTVFVDEAVSFADNQTVYEPRNFDKTYLGPMTLKWALMQSRNVVAVKLIDRIGPAATVQYAHRLGIESALPENLSLALGAAGVSPFEMAAAYCTFASQGIRREPYLIRHMHTVQNVELERYTAKSARVIDAQTAYQLLDMLRGVVEAGTAASLRAQGFLRPCAGKTGTSSDNRDCWFVGFTPDLVTAVWVGFDDNRRMIASGGVELTGAGAALPLWARFMQQAVANSPYSDFPIPPGIEFVEIDPRTGAGPVPGGPHITVAQRSARN